MACSVRGKKAAKKAAKKAVKKVVEKQALQADNPEGPIEFPF
jgi:hypothetical protein